MGKAERNPALALIQSCGFAADVVSDRALRQIVRPDMEPRWMHSLLDVVTELAQGPSQMDECYDDTIACTKLLVGRMSAAV